MSHHHSIRRGTIPKPEIIYEIPDDIEASKPKEILILEDEADLASLLQSALESAGYAVTIVTSGAEGLKKILASDYNVILCDMVMPSFPGDMFYRAVERARPQLCKRFIFMTGHHGDRKIEQFIRGIQGLMLWKPFEMNDLFEDIKLVLQKN